MDPLVDTSVPMAGRREWLGLAVLALAGLLLSVDASVLFVALPEITENLRASSTELLWITDVYGFLLAGFLVTMGRVGDLFGRRRLLILGSVCFGEISVLAAYSTDATELIAARGLLGVVGATIVPSAMALIPMMFPNPKQQGTALAVFVSCFMGGAVLGPVAGGVLLTHFWWGSVFLLNVPVMILIVVTAPRLLPEYSNPAGSKLDLASVGLYLVAILPLIYGINELGRVGWHPGPVIGVLVGLAFVVVFLRKQRTSPEPLLELGLFRHRAFSSVLTLSLFAGAALAAMGLFFTQFIQVVRGWSPLATGMLTVLSALSMITGSLVAPVVARRIRPGTVAAAGFAIMTVGFLLISRVQVDAQLAVLVIGLDIVTLGAGAFVSVGTILLMGSVPPEKIGAAASISETGGELGTALGIATLGTIGTAIYRNLLIVPVGIESKAGKVAGDGITLAKAVSDALPAGIRSVFEYPVNNDAIIHVMTTTTAGPALGGKQVVSSGGGVPGTWSVGDQGLGKALLEAAKVAFTTAFQGVTLIAAAMAAALAVLAYLTLRHLPPTGVTAPAGPAEEPVLTESVPAEPVSTGPAPVAAAVAAPVPVSEHSSG
ncbi:MFS transporter [Jatrophihabitans sp.]|uniref:MFS transporter n=1 Tax=Jatrophihabitans sp. TaxID=1932789 RepID=UPI002C416719|nr:MFS transporter [Jatrophihabitans sp.]